MAPKFFATFFFVAKSLREKNCLRFFMFSSWYQIRSMQHVNHEAVKPQSFIFTPPSFKPWKFPKGNFWPDRTAERVNFRDP